MRKETMQVVVGIEYHKKLKASARQKGVTIKELVEDIILRKLKQKV